MKEIMTRVKGMIEELTQAERLIVEKRLKEERAKADAKLARELVKADEKLEGELAKANNRIDKLQSKLHSSNDRTDEMFYKLQEVNAVTMDTLEWIFTWGHSFTGSNQTAKPAQHRAGKTCFVHPTYRYAHWCFTHLARSTGIHPRFFY